MDFSVVLEILKNYGPLGLILVTVIYVVVNGDISFKYPRSGRKK